MNEPKPSIATGYDFDIACRIAADGHDATGYSLHRTAIIIHAALAAERERCANMAAQWRKNQHILLHAGEMTAAELRIAVAVASGIEAAIRALPAEGDPPCPTS